MCDINCSGGCPACAPEDHNENIIFGIAQNGISWHLQFDCLAPDNKEQAIKYAYNILKQELGL